jgi:hypothetical protein
MNGMAMLFVWDQTDSAISTRKPGKIYRVIGLEENQKTPRIDAFLAQMPTAKTPFSTLPTPMNMANYAESSAMPSAIEL